jgi:hypothetical protein
LKSYRVYNRLGRILRRKHPHALICPLTPPYAEAKSWVLTRQAG